MHRELPSATPAPRLLAPAGPLVTLDGVVVTRAASSEASLHVVFADGHVTEWSLSWRYDESEIVAERDGVRIRHEHGAVPGRHPAFVTP